MDIEFDKSFLKFVCKIDDVKIRISTEKVILNCKSAKTLYEIQNLKKLSGYSVFYRIKIGDYRIGFELINKTIIRFIVIAHRKDIYKKFP